MMESFFGFIGHNGAGKTTTIKAIVGIHDFEEGEVLINSKSIKKQPVECKRKWHIYLIIRFIRVINGYTIP